MRIGEENRTKRRDEAVLLRGFYLRVLRRWYLLPLSVLAGALIGAAVYYCVHVIYAPAREYAGGARLYLEFSPDAAGNARDFYNAWTWRELITSDEILNTAMGELIEAGVSEERERTGDGLSKDHVAVKKEDDELWLVSQDLPENEMITRAEVLESTMVRLPSDLRVMMLTVTHRDPAFVNHVLTAMTDALVTFGENNENFREIRVLETTPALMVVTTDRTRTAVIWGGVLGFLICLFLLFLYYAMDDALYDPEMCGRRFDVPVLGVLSGRQGQPDEEFAGLMKRELRAGSEARLKSVRRAAILTASGREHESVRVGNALTDALGAHFLDGACAFVSVSDASELTAGGFDAAIVAVPFGKRNGAYADHLLAELVTQRIPVAGLVLYDVDLRYLKILYGM
ncbi:MAG: hypothetical protein K6G16_11400 [Lachnospiraceae bacterium]|nr:hypothetical protein [Lachnospiraceae bacterium]